MVVKNLFIPCLNDGDEWCQTVGNWINEWATVENKNGCFFGRIRNSKIKKAADKTSGSSVDRDFIHVCQYFN
jgi:hypothetical protein